MDKVLKVHFNKVINYMLFFKNINEHYP